MRGSAFLALAIHPHEVILMLTADIIRHSAEIARNVRNQKYEFIEPGLLIPEMGIIIGGAFTSMVNGRDEQIDPNIVTTEGKNWTLSVLAKNSTPVATWYIAPFSGNVTPAITLTAATFDSVCTEFEDYDEATREAWTTGTVASGAVGNSASKAEFTIKTGVTNVVLYGAGVLSIATKGAGTGVCFAASRFSTSRTVNATDVLTVGYTLTLTDAA